MKEVRVATPLVDWDFNELPATKEFLKNVGDDNETYEIHLEVSDLEMVPTAVSLSLKERFNATYQVSLSNFPGSAYIFGFLLSTHMKGHVTWL